MEEMGIWYVKPSYRTLLPDVEVVEVILMQMADREILEPNDLIIACTFGSCRLYLFFA